jgi:sodium-dependent dicarboxylate transporter 2/3/5
VHSSRIQRFGRCAGPLAGLAALLWTHPDVAGRGSLGADASWVLALVAWMAVWWLCEAVDLAVTALLPVVLLPLLGVGSFRDVAASYADNIIFLFAGSAVMGLALDRHGVSARFVQLLLQACGTRPALVVAVMMLASTLMSGFISNMATTVTMLPLALGVAGRAVPALGASDDQAERGRRHFGIAVLLAVAYGSTIGGMATVIGTAPNALAANYLQANGHAMDFAAWARVGYPLTLTLAPLAAAVMLWMLPVRGIALREPLEGEHGVLGTAGWVTAAVFVLVVAVWCTSPVWPGGWKPTGLTDGGVAIAAAVLLLTLPARDGSGERVVPWQATRELPWGVFLLFGGGLAMSEAMQRSGLADAVGASVAQLGVLPQPIAVAMVAAGLNVASEVASNTALTATAVPILGAVAPQLGLSVPVMAITAALGASCSFMLPVGTPPNALVYATGRVPQGVMIRVGLLLNVLAVLAITVWVLALM